MDPVVKGVNKVFDESIIDTKVPCLPTSSQLSSVMLPIYLQEMRSCKKESVIVVDNLQWNKLFLYEKNMEWGILHTALIESLILITCQLEFGIKR